MVEVRRIGDAPIIDQALSPTLGDNINGPSLVARPSWAPGPGRYMLYFAHHHGKHVRLAFGDRLEGPWWVHKPGVLPLETTPFARERLDLPQPDWAIDVGADAWIPHLASPDVHIDNAARRFEMLVHGLCGDGVQKSCLAISEDGLDWRIKGPVIMQTYLRRFEVGSGRYAIGLHGQLLRAMPDGGYELGPFPLPERIRHVGVLRRESMLHVLFSRYGDAPERLLHSILDLRGDWRDWRETSEPMEILRPERAWEGAFLPTTQSLVGATAFTNALRDPVLFEEEDRLFLIYAGGGEAALGLAEITGIR